MINNSGKRYITFTIIFIPIIIFLGELFSFSLYSIRKNLKAKGVNENTEKQFFHKNKTSDLISGSYRYNATKEDLENQNGYINRHGLIKTEFVSDSNLQKDTKGILITGNSVALGLPMPHMGRNKDSFVNILEAQIRKEDKSLDVINLSFYGMNSWQETIELNRYFNSESNHNDLPSNIKLIASVGGIQDFWGFIDLLYNKTDYANNYSYANGLLIKYQSFNFFNESYQALKGNIYSGFKIFIASLVNNIKTNSNMYKILLALKDKIKIIDDQKLITLPNKNNLSEIISNKINISSAEYYRKKDIAVKSVARNIKLMQSLNTKGKFIYVYLPTRFGFEPSQINERNRILVKENLNVSDLYLLEKDYKNSLIKYLLDTYGIEVINISTKAEDNWFYDESHYSAVGHEKIANTLTSNFLKILN